MLIKNCILFGVCDGHGKNGSEISNLISVLYPSYIFYLIIDNNLIKKRQELNDLMLKLFQLEESPEKTKDKHILRYILNKLGVDCSCIPFVSGDKKELFNLLFESIHLSRNDLTKRFKIDIEYSGTTLCSGILSGNKLYISNIGDSRVVLGIFNNKGNIWKSKPLSIDHEPSSPNENRRIIQCNGRIDRFKNAFGEEFGKLRVFEKDIESIKPALAMTRSIGDDEAKKIGVIYEPELFVYDIGNDHRILVVGSDGLWSYMTNEEVIEIAGRCYDNGGKAEEASSILIETAKNRWLQNTKKNEKTKREKNNTDDIYGGKKSEGELEHKKHKKSYDDITCLVIFLNVK
jgi:serine/threonine protein phosphatase PrpC